ncbi:MAG: shikimate kinase [Candidatus Sulfotelmatobacter sp.]
MKKRSGKTVRAQASKGPRRRRLRSFSPGNAVFLVGFMGAGKSSVGRALGQLLSWDFEDLDDRIERREGRSVAEIFREAGELGFRRAEHGALRQVLEDLPSTARVIALGGGAFVQEKNAMLLKSSGVATVFLDAPVDELWKRCSRQANDTGAERPLLGSREQFKKLYETRRKTYKKASIMIQTGNRAVDAIAAEIIETLELKKIELRVQEGEVE